MRLQPDREPSRTYYQVLDISPDEQDPKVIEEAALRCSSHVRAYQLTRESECTLRLNEIARALITLLDPVRRREYDLGLGKPLGPAAVGAPATWLGETLLPCCGASSLRPPRARIPSCFSSAMGKRVMSSWSTGRLVGRGIARRTVEKMLTMFRSIPSPALKGA